MADGDGSADGITTVTGVGEGLIFHTGIGLSAGVSSLSGDPRSSAAVSGLAAGKAKLVGESEILFFNAKTYVGLTWMELTPRS